MYILYPVRVEGEVPVEAAVGEVRGLHLAGLGRVLGGVLVVLTRQVVAEDTAGHAEVSVEHGPDMAHAQLQLELAVVVSEVADVELADRDVVAVALGRTLRRELDLVTFNV